jgi:hypothetical protein
LECPLGGKAKCQEKRRLKRLKKSPSLRLEREIDVPFVGVLEVILEDLGFAECALEN